MPATRMLRRITDRRRLSAALTLELLTFGSIQVGVIAGLDPAIHPLRKKGFWQRDGPAGQARG
jgi:hypothetical protein